MHACTAQADAIVNGFEARGEQVDLAAGFLVVDSVCIERPKAGQQDELDDVIDRTVNGGRVDGSGRSQQIRQPRRCSAGDGENMTRGVQDGIGVALDVVHVDVVAGIFGFALCRLPDPWRSPQHVERGIKPDKPRNGHAERVVGKGRRDLLGPRGRQRERGREQLAAEGQQPKPASAGEPLANLRGEENPASADEAPFQVQVHPLGPAEEVDDLPGGGAHVCRRITVEAGLDMLKEPVVLTDTPFNMTAGTGETTWYVN